MNWQTLFRREWPLFVAVGNLKFWDAGARLSGAGAGVLLEGDQHWVTVATAEGARSACQKACEQLLVREPGYVDALLAEIDAHGERFARIASTWLDLGSRSLPELVACYAQYLQAYLDYCVQLATSLWVVEDVSGLFRKHVEHLVGPAEAPAVIGAYSQPSQKAAPLRISEALATMSSEGERAHYLATEFPWIGSSEPFTVPYGAADFAQLAANRQAAPQPAVESSYRLPETALIQQYQTALYLKDRRDEFRRRGFHAGWPLMSQLATRLGLTTAQLSLLLPDDLSRDGLAALAAARSTGYSVEYYGGAISVQAGQAASAGDQRPAPTGREVRGAVGCRGRVQGEVQIIRGRDDVRRFERGRVLVAVTTNPHHLMAMQRAIAFVTDEGGIGCHAAIVAREFGKPCIVGTGDATQVLRDGDTVDVDADRGVVTVLGRAG